MYMVKSVCVCVSISWSLVCGMYSYVYGVYVICVRVCVCMFVCMYVCDFLCMCVREFLMPVLRSVCVW